LKVIKIPGSLLLFVLMGIWKENHIMRAESINPLEMGI